MYTSTFNALRAKYGGLIRDRAPDDPELVDTKHAMQAEALVAAVEKAMRKAPPMTDDLRQRIIGLRHDRSGTFTLLMGATALKSRHQQWESPF